MIEPQVIQTDDGDVVLAPTKGAAAVWAEREWGDVELVFESWWLDVGYDADEYSNRKDFLEHSGYSSWWERRSGPPANFLVTPGYMPGWLVVWS
jgi:hypothetical protein